MNYKFELFPELGNYDFTDNYCEGVSEEPESYERANVNICACGRRADYGFEGGTRITCFFCKLDSHINLRLKKCCFRISENTCCGRSAKYFVKDNKHITFCSKHKTDECIANPANVKCKCGARASYALPGNRAETCSKHKLLGYVNIYVMRCYCGKQASYGTERGKPITCYKHKEKEYVRVKGKLCICGKWPSYGPVGGKRISCKSCKEDNHVAIK